MKKFFALIVAVLLCACASAPKVEKTLAEEAALREEAVVNDEASVVQVFPHVLGMVQSAVFSPDGRYVLTGDHGGAVRVWEAESGVLRKTYYGHEMQVMSVAWSPDGRFIASGSLDHTIKIWNADFSSEAQEIHTLRHEDEVYSVAFSHDSRYVVSSSRDKTVRIWEAATGGEIAILRGHQNTISSAAFSPDDRCIVSASADMTVKIWALETGRIRTLYGHTDFIRSVAWSPNGKQVISASYDSTVRIWDAETGAEHIVIGKGIFDGQVNNVRFSPEGNRIVTAGGFLYINDIIIWDAETGGEIRRFPGHSNSILSTEWDSTGKRIVSASYDNTAKLWDVETGEFINTFAGNTEFLRKATMSRDRKRLVTGSNGKKVNIWNAETGVLERSLEFLALVNAVAISPDGHLVAAGGYDEKIMLWKTETGNEVWPLRGHRNSIYDLTFHPGGKYLASASGDSTIRIWDVETGEITDTLIGHTGPVQSLTFSANGRFLVSGSRDKTVRIWEAVDGQTGRYRFKLALTGHFGYVFSVTISSDNRMVASGSFDRTVRIWDVETGRELDNLVGRDFFLGNIRSVAFSSDNSFIIAGDSNNRIHQWEIDSDRGIYKGALEGLQGVPRSLAYTTDDKRILAGISDGTARLYNADDFSEIACFVYFKGEDAETVATGRGSMSEEAEQAVSQIDGEWLTITPDGFYRGSPKGDRFINVLINGRDLTSMDSYSDFFYRPDIVWARLTGQPDPEKPTFTIQQAANFRPPAITILSPQPGTTVTDGAVTISVSVTDRNRPIEDIRILVNGVRLGSNELKEAKGTSGIQVKEGEGRLLVTGSQKSVQFTVPVTLVERGSNRIEVMAFNGISWGYSGYTGSVTVNWNPPAGVEVPLPDLWILAVGVNKYDNANTDKLRQNINQRPLGNLNYCGNDAKRLVESFKAQEGEGKRYKTVHTRLITDNEIEPTAANIREQLKFLEGANQRDVVLLFMAGHGISEEGRFYFLTRDAVMENGKVNPLYAISDQELKPVLDLPGRRLIFIDACQSGGMDINQFMYSLRRTNAYMLSSSEGDKPSYEDNPDRNFWQWDGHGVFSYSVIRGLNGMARPRNDSAISVLQLSGYVRNMVMNLTEKGIRFPYQQKPVQYSWGFSDFDIAR